jgi:hypothetical protein
MEILDGTQYRMIKTVLEKEELPPFAELFRNGAIADSSLQKNFQLKMVMDKLNCQIQNLLLGNWASRSSREQNEGYVQSDIPATELTTGYSL